MPWKPCPASAIVLNPSLLAANQLALKEAVDSLAGADIQRLHVDVMDGTFVPNFSIGLDVIRELSTATSFPLEIHLMIDHPDTHLETFAKAGAAGLIVHAEVCPHLHRSLEQIRRLGCSAGAALNPSTPLDALDHVYEQLDLALVMTVNPGFGGQSFISAMLPKLTALRDARDARGASFEIEVDGGIGPDTAVASIEAGATTLVAGTSVFGDALGAPHGVAVIRERLESVFPG